MKKLLGIVVLGLLWCNISFAETVELEQGIKLNIPKGYAHTELNYKDYYYENTKDVLSDKEREEIYENLGITGMEKMLLIGKDADYGIVNFYQHTYVDGKKPEEWRGLIEVDKKCGSKNSEKAFMKCFAKLLSDPTITAVVSGAGSPLIDELSEIIQEIKNDPNLQKDLKLPEKFKENLGLLEMEGTAKMVHLDKKKWSGVVNAKTPIMGMKMKATSYLLPHNNHIFAIATSCISKKNCKDVDKKVIEILQPYLSKLEEKAETKAKPEKKEKKIVKKKKEPSETQEVAEKEIVWEIIGKNEYNDNFSLHSKKSFILKKSHYDYLKQLRNMLEEGIKTCGLSCKISVLKYYEPNDPSKNRKLVFTPNIKILDLKSNLNEIKISWSGMQSGSFFEEGEETQITKKKSETKETTQTQQALPKCKEPYLKSEWNNCIGTVKWSGATYVGEYVLGNQHGQGTMTWANGDKYVGEFTFNYFTGQGTMTWTNGDKYVGEWKMNKRHGKGTFTRADGSVKEGIWEKNKLVQEKITKEKPKKKKKKVVKKKKEPAQTDDSSNVDLTKDLIKIPVHVHILDINEKRYKTKTKPKHVEVHFRRVNKIWAPANIFWDLKKIDYIPADTTNFKSNIEWIYKHPYNKKNNANNEINKRRYKNTHQLLQIERNQKQGHINVYYVPYIFELMCGFMQNFANPFPRQEYLVMGHIMNPKYKKDNLFCKVQGTILAHELGHMLYLEHDPQKHFLMGEYGGIKIPEKTIIEARENYKKHLEEYLEQ